MENERGAPEAEAEAIVLREQVRRKSVELDEALREIERLGRDVQEAREKLREHTLRDPLTGLYNRHYVEDALGRELIGALRIGRPVSVVLADIDRLQAVNARYGRTAGDEVLRALGILMYRACRENDIVCRYGGEEFLLVLPGLGPESVGQRIEQLRACVEAAAIRHEASSIGVTASFGVAMFPGDGISPAALIAAAENALYVAKNCGRNRIVFHKVMPPEI